MPRAIWSGSISFGLVNVPVKAFTASRDHAVHFHQLEKGTGARIRYEKVSDKSGKEVDADDIELGYELSSGRYVTVDPDELDELRPRTTRTIDVEDFVALDDIDPIYYTKTYWLAPDGDSAAHAYRLLLEAMEEQRRVGIGSVVIRRKQYLAALRPLDGALAMSTMRFADEVVDKAKIDAIPRRTKADKKELRLATQIVDSLASDWDPTRYKDTYTDELRDLIERRSKGEKVTVEEGPAQGDNVIDLMQALEASVAAAKKARGGNVAKELAKTADELAREAEADAEEEAEADDDAAQGRSSSTSRSSRAKGGTGKKRASTSAKRAKSSSGSASKGGAKKAAAKKAPKKTSTKAAKKRTQKRSARAAA